MKHGGEFGDACPLGRGECDAGVAHCVIELHQELLHVQLVGREDVRLVECKDDRNGISLGGGKETVDECRGCLGIIDRHDKHRLIYIGGDDMALLREILRFADDIVTAVGYLGDEGGAFAVGLYGHTVAHGNGIGAADALQAEVALYLTIDGAPLVGEHRVPISCVSYYKSCHA